MQERSRGSGFKNRITFQHEGNCQGQIGGAKTPRYNLRCILEEQRGGIKFKKLGHESILIGGIILGMQATKNRLQSIEIKCNQSVLCKY